MTARSWLRLGLVFLALAQGVPALWAAVLPWSFFFSFPVPGHSWVAMFPPYNEHLARDLGMATLQFVLVLLFAAASANPLLVRVALIGSLVFNVPHMVFHLGHLGRFGAVDVVAQLIVQVVPVVLALVLLWLSWRMAASGVAQQLRSGSDPTGSL